MKKEEIIKGNIMIANYMGWKLDDSFPDKGRVYRLGNSVELDSTLKYDSSLDLLFEVIEKINGKGKEYNFAIFKTYVSLSVEKGGKVYKDFSFAHSENISKEQGVIEAIYKVIIKYINWENGRNK
jgi:hypothetical protein